MKKINLILILISFIGCSPNINKSFNRNRYVTKGSTHITNDSLKLYLNSPGDIIYSTNEKNLKKIINSKKYKIHDEIILYGETKDPPYEYYLTTQKANKNKYNENLIILDTIIKHKKLRLIGCSEKNHNTLKIDLNRIYKTIDIGDKYKKPITSIFEVVDKFKNSNKYLSGYNELNLYPINSKNEKWNKLQMLLTFSSFLGENNPLYKKNINFLESKFKGSKEINTVINNNISENNLDFIVEKAEKHKILMINENHFYPNHRLLVTDLLKKLKKVGYTYIALEALDKNQDSILNLESSYPTLKNGFYIKEQNFSNLIRTAKKYNYKFVSYENFDNNKLREEGQAENLYNKTFKINKESKVLVLAGIDHILEKEIKNKKWLACVLKEKYNIDPLTISQTHLNSYRKLTNNEYSIINSSIFNNEKLKAVDYHILNNKTLKNVKKSKFNYKNITNDHVQLSLFYSKECLKRYSYIKNCPYYTILVKKNENVSLPIFEDTEVYIFDKNGRKIEHKKYYR